MNKSFQNYFFGLLPNHFKINDSHKDINNRGLLERYLEIFGLELDEEVIVASENFPRIFNPLETDDKYLNHLAYSLGNPPDLLGDPNTYAKLLNGIVSVYKIKGTIPAYELFFALLGFNVTVTEIPPAENVTFDSGSIFDSGLTFEMGCATCIEYNLTFSGYYDDPDESYLTALSNETINLLSQVAIFNEPLNAKLKELTNALIINEGLNICIGEYTTVKRIEPNSLDDGLIFDNSILFDNSTIVSTATIDNPCNL